MVAWRIRWRPPPAAGESGQAMPRIILALIFVALGLVVAVTAITVYAIWTNTASVTPNDFASDTLDPATSLTAAGSPTSIQLDWTASVDTYATGYKIMRATTSSGPYTEIDSVTPVTTATYTDGTVVTDTTYFYVLNTYHQNWESANGNEASAFVGTCTAGDTGFLSPTAEVADTGGDADGFESNPTGAFADAGGIASNINGPADRHRYYNYAFSIPGACSVLGIEARLDWWLDAVNGINSMDVELSWDGGR